jgi:hypothetical protein
MLREPLVDFDPHTNNANIVQLWTFVKAEKIGGLAHLHDNIAIYQITPVYKDWHLIQISLIPWRLLVL